MLMKMRVKENANIIRETNGAGCGWDSQMNMYLGKIIEVTKHPYSRDKYLGQGWSWNELWLDSVTEPSPKKASEVSMKTFVTKTQKLPSDKLIVLIRDGHTYYRQDCDNTVFYSLFSRGQTCQIRTLEEIKSTDKLYAFDKNEQIAETLNASGCLNKFLLKIESGVTFTQVYEAVKAGKFVGATRVCVGDSVDGAKVAVRISPYPRHKQPALYAFYNNGKDSDLVGSQGNCDFKNGSSGTHKDFVWTDNEFEFWKWLNS